MACSKEYMMFKEMDEMFTCAVCLQQLTRPRQLPCLHVFCTGCLQTLMARPDIAGLCCPACRTVTYIPSEGVLGFPEDFRLKSLIEIKDRFQPILSNKKVVNCLVCEEDGKESQAFWVCSECHMSTLCQSCSKHHNKFQKDHNLVSIKDCGEHGLADLMKNRPVMCSQHDERIKFLCSCNLMICMACTVIDHARGSAGAKHETKQEISKIVESKKQELIDTKKHLDIELATLSEEIDGGKKAVAYTKAKIDDGVTEIHKRAEELINMVKEREKEVVQELQCKGQEHQARISMSVGNVQEIKEHVEKAIKKVNGVFENGTDVDIIQLSLENLSNVQDKNVSLTCDKAVPKLSLTFPTVNGKDMLGSVSVSNPISPEFQDEDDIDHINV